MTHFIKALKHKPPFYMPVGLTVLSFCVECCTLAAATDVPSAKPCPSCGGVVVADKLYGEWKRTGGGWFRAEVGEWMLTVRTQVVLGDLYNHFHKPKLVSVKPAVKPNTDFDLDFTK